MTTGETIWRESRFPARCSPGSPQSHVRVGTFQFFAARGDVEAIRQLADYVIARHYPEAAGEENPYLALLKR